MCDCFAIVLVDCLHSCAADLYGVWIWRISNWPGFLLVGEGRGRCSYATRVSRQSLYLVILTSSRVVVWDPLFFIFGFIQSLFFYSSFSPTITDSPLSASPSRPAFATKRDCEFTSQSPCMIVDNFSRHLLRFVTDPALFTSPLWPITAAKRDREYYICSDSWGWLWIVEIIWSYRNRFIIHFVSSETGVSTKTWQWFRRSEWSCGSVTQRE